MRKCVITSVILTIILALLFMSFIFTGYQTSSSDDLLTAFHNLSSLVTRPVLAEEVQRIVQDYGDSDEGFVHESIPVPSPPGGEIGVPSAPVVPVAGKYYFHQSSRASCTCGTHGPWSTATWGKNGTTSKFASNGCAIYSLSMAISNLVGKEVNPLTLLIGLGCTVNNPNAGKIEISTNGSSCFSGVAIYRERTLETVRKLYGLNFRQVRTHNEALAALEQGNVLWTCVQGSKWNSTANTHFVAIYSCDGTNYYAYDSSNMNYVNNPEPVAAFWGGHIRGPVYAIGRS